MQERPLFRLWQPEPSHSDILQQVRQLGPADRDQFYSLSNSEEDESIPEEKGIWVTNSFQIDNTYKGIFPIASRINSSCRPNLFYTQDHAITGLQFRALRTIQANEELCHAYIPELHVRSKRRKLYRNWGFTCMCELCEAPEEEVEESDQRIRMINRLDEIIDRPRDASTLSDKDYWSAVSWVLRPLLLYRRVWRLSCYLQIWRLLHLLKLEGRLQLRFDVVCTAYKRAVAARDAAQCRTWAKRCYKYGKLQFGHRDTRTREWAKRVCSWEVKLNNIKEASAEL